MKRIILSLFLIALFVFSSFAAELDKISFNLKLKKQGETALYFYDTDSSVPVSEFDFGIIKAREENTETIGVYYAVYPYDTDLTIDSLNIYFVEHTATAANWTEPGYMFSRDYEDNNGNRVYSGGLNANVTFSGGQNNLSFLADDLDAEVSLEERTIKLVTGEKPILHAGTSESFTGKGDLTFTIKPPNNDAQILGGRYSGYVVLELKTS